MGAFQEGVDDKEKKHCKDRVLPSEEGQSAKVGGREERDGPDPYKTGNVSADHNKLILWVGVAS